jgi:predicted Zn-dependent peptidase
MKRFLTAFTLTLTFALVTPPRILAAAPRVAEGTTSPAAAATAVRSEVRKLDIKEIHLENGLRIFVLERTASPTFAGYYQFGVGGAVDPKGRTGIAHLLEHMMFKGTKTVGTLDPVAETPIMRRLAELWHELNRELDRAEDPFQKPNQERIDALKKEIERLTEEQKTFIVKNEYDELMTRAGGISLNASTSNDHTNYFIQLPANRLELWFQLESDRLLNPVFREFWSERDVVHEERRTSTENQAEGLAWEALERLIFLAHPYGNPVVGWPSDVARLKEEDALRYFQTYYSPSNCIMVLVGDVKAAEVERLARKYLGSWKRRDIPSLEITAEPDQRGERRAVIEFDSQPQLYFGWRTVPQGHPDQYPLEVLARILGGLQSSRLDKTVVQEQKIASSVGAFQGSLKRAGSFEVFGYLKREHTVAELEASIDREIRNVQESGVTAEELDRAKIRTEVSRVRNLKSNLGQAFRIARAVSASGGLDYLYEYEARMEAVTAADVQRVADEYLEPSRRCVVEVRRKPGVSGAPTGERAADVHHRGGTPGERGARHSVRFQGAMAAMKKAKPLTLTIPEIGKDVDRVVLPSGVTVFIKEDRSAPSVEMQFSWLGGSNTTPVSQLAPFEIASQLLTEGGTEALDPIALNERKEQLGMSFSLRTGTTGSGASFWSLKRNFPDSFSLAMEMLMKPRLEPKRLEVIKGQYVDDMRRRYDYPGWGVDLVGSHVIDHDHPRLGYQATKREIESVTPDDVRKIWRRYLGRDNLFITAVGDFDKKGILDLIERTFASWRAAEDKKREWITRDPVIRPGLYVVEKEVSAPAILVRHHIKVDRTAPLEDHAALEIMNDILGGSGFRSRLMERLRSDEGLTYGIYSWLAHDHRPGVPGEFGASYETKKVSVARSIQSVLEEIVKMVEGRVTAAEVEEQVEAWRNRFVFEFENDFYSVSRLLSLELDDRPYDHEQKLLDAVQKVTPADIERVARKYLKPDNLTIALFGRLTDEDRKALEGRFTVNVLRKEEVFRGGYDLEEAPKGEAAGGGGASPGVTAPASPPD